MAGKKSIPKVTNLNDLHFPNSVPVLEEPPFMLSLFF